MNINEVSNKYKVSEATLKNWKKLNYIADLDNIKDKEIKSILNNKIGIRRNKKNSSDNIIPESYVKDKRIIKIVDSILELKNKYSINKKEILHETILKILKKNNLSIPNEVETVLGKQSNNNDFKKAFSKIKIEYDEDNDFLGCLYMSLLSIGNKDINGIFYTPFTVVNKIIKSMDFTENAKILDPGCGSGNFLIQAYKKMKDQNIATTTIINNLYGFDIDKLAVLLSKINIYILDKDIDFNKINVYKKDFLYNKININFDFVIGNPPWGKKYTPKQRERLKKKYNTSFSKMDSFAQFIVRSFSIMNDQATLGFVLPTSILNIAVHEEVRKFLLNYKIEYIKNIGRKFEEIVTGVVILKVIKDTPNNNVCLYNNTHINQEEFKENKYNNFLILDSTSSSILRKLKAYPSFHLIDNVDYALGIVTGNNKDYISSKKTRTNEPIISGKDMDRYNVDYSKIKNYIYFNKDKLQQVAKEEFYRNRNKIIYKFIGKKLCFAVENRSTLTLNSANVICLGNNYDLFYVSAILNSRITQLYFEDTYNTHKVLKNHIQSFFIPDFNNNLKKEISRISKQIKPTSDYCDEIEELIYRELNLTNKEIKYLKNRF